MQEKEFKEELEVIINKHGVDAWMRTPDFLVAESLWKHLKELRRFLYSREGWADDAWPVDDFAPGRVLLY